MTSIWFVTPAWQRYQLSAVCFDQRLDVIRSLARHGIEARCVVVADDENLDLARGHGFEVVEQDNEWLGRRFNDGIEYAARAGADWIVPIGSDSWIDPAYFLPLPNRHVTRTSERYCAVTADRLADLRVASASGAGPYMLHRSILPPGFRPARDDKKRSIDKSTIAGLARPPRWERCDVSPYQYVGFRGAVTLTPYEKLVAAWGLEERTDPWQVLAAHYPEQLVAWAQAAVAAGG